MRFLKVFLITVAIVVALVVFALYQYFGRMTPPNNATYIVGVKDTVKVVMDDYGMPHIYAKNLDDLVFAQGFLHARDRLFGMELTRRAAQGRLSEILGKDLLDTDIFLRTIGFDKIIDSIWEILTPEEKHILEVYAKGVNAYLKQGKMPPEFKLLGIKPEPWDPKQSLGYIRLMGWDLSSGFNYDWILYQIRSKVDSAKFAEIVPSCPSNAPQIIPINKKFLMGMKKFKNIFGGLGVSGSNSWVVSGKKSVTGKPILANDPHLSIKMPILWYEVHLVAPGINLYGVSLPALPFVVIGHNDRIAWGLTNVMMDDADLVIEKVNPDNPNQYWYHGKWVNFIIKTDTIRIKGSKPYILKTKWTVHGPVVSDIKKIKDKVVALRWTGYMKTDEFRAILKIAKAKNWQEFLDGVQYFQVPGQNFLYADVDGNIGYVTGSGIPDRKPGPYYLPMNADDPGVNWTNFIPFDKNPKVYNPEQGFIATANCVIDWNFPYYITVYWEPAARIERINQVLRSKDKFSIEDFKKLQMDDTPPWDKVIKKRMVKDLYSYSGTPLENKAKKILMNWNGQEDKDSVGVTIFYFTLKNIMRETFADELGDSLYEQFASMGNQPLIVLYKLYLYPYDSWFDNVKTKKVETRKDITIKAFREAVAELKSLRGSNPSNWKWGYFHTFEFHHPFGSKAILRKIFNRGPYPVSGSNISINKAQWKWSKPFSMVTGPSTRQIVDLSNINNSLAVIASGNSGIFTSKHYDDQIKLWLNGGYRQVYMDRKDILAHSEGTIYLIPK